MSVWKTVSYRDDCLQLVGKNLPLEAFLNGDILKFANFETEFCGELCEGVNLVKGNVAEQFRDRPADIAKMIPGAHGKPSYSLWILSRKFSKVTTGLDACFKVIGQSWENIWRYKGESNKDLTMESQIFAIGMAGGYHSAGDVGIRLDQLDDSFKRDGIGPEVFIKELHQCASAHKRKGFFMELKIMEAAMKELPPVTSKLAVFMPGWDVYTFRGILILHHIVTGEALFLLQKDLDRIEKFVVGASYARLYSRMYGALKEESRSKLVSATIKWQNLCVEVFSGTARKNEVCRAFDIAYFIHLAEVAGDTDTYAKDLQVKKYKDGKYGDIVAYGRILRCVGDLAFKERLEVLQQYKLFPAPDFDSYAQADRQKDLYNEYAHKHDLSIESVHYTGILLYHRWMMTIAFFDRHKHCPGYVLEEGIDMPWAASFPYCDPRKIPFRDSRFICFDGAFVFNDRSGDCFDLLKDKAICPERIGAVRNAADLHKIPAAKRTQLLDVLSRPDLPNLDELAKNVENLFMDVKADDKPEAKKPNGRWFFEAHSDIRLLLSEYEDSNADYARHFPGAVVGLDVVDVKKRVNAASAPGVNISGEIPLYVSFDIEKFSPAFNIQVSKDLDEIWAEAYGKPHVRQLSRILTDGKIHYVKSGFHHEFDKQGADFEGFFGRRNTMYHCAVMGYAVNTLRKEGMVKRGAHFATLIDDGLLRLMVDDNIGPEFYADLRNKLEEIYRGGSMQLSWDKTFISHKTCVFLNEIRYMGRSVTPGMKAVLRINNMSDDICPNLLCDLELVAATTRGALSSGSTPCATYAVYAVSVSKAIRRWGKLSKKVSALGIVRSFMPARMGGLSLCGLMALAGSVTHDDLSESLGVLRIVGFRYKAFQNAIRCVVSPDVSEIGGLARFTNPHGVRTSGRCVRRDRGPARIKRYLLTHADLPAIDHYIMAVKEVSEVKDIRLPAVKPRFPVELRERIWHSTPEHVLEGIVSKFLRARTALCFVPFRVLYRATIANKTEAKALVTELF